MIPVIEMGVSEVISLDNGREEVNWRIFPWESRSWKNWSSLPSFLFGRRSHPCKVCDLLISSGVIEILAFVGAGILTST